MAGHSYPSSVPPGTDTSFPYVWAHNPSAWVGIALCIFLLLLWRDRNAVYLRKRRQDWRDGD